MGKRQQKDNKQTKQFSKQQINAQILRNSFLEQASYLLNSINSQNNSNKNTYNLLARLTLREIRELCFVDQIKMHRNFKRNFCKRCFNCWLAPESGKNDISIKIKRISKRQKSVILKCKNCQNCKTFPFNVNYKSRNEKKKKNDEE